MVINKRVVDRLICYLVSFMIMSFYLFELKSWGRYVLIGITLIITILYSWQNKWHFKFKLSAFHKHIALFTIYCFISSVWAWNPSLAISKGVTILSILICFSLLYSYYEREENVDSLLKSIMIAGYGIAMYTIFYYGFPTIIGMTIGGIRLENDYTNVNSIGMVSALSCIIQLYYVLKKKVNILIVFVLPALLMVAASQSRKAVVMMLIGTMLLIILGATKSGILKKIGRIIAGAIIFVIMIYFLSRVEIFSGVMARFMTYYESLSGIREVNIRDIYRQIGLEQFRTTPIVGIGIGNSAELLESVGQRRTYLHDNFVELLACGGIVGFIIYYSIYIRLIFGLWKYRCQDFLTTNLCLIFLVLLFVMDYGMVSYFDKQQYIYFMCFFLQLDIIKKKYIRKRHEIMRR